MLQVEGVSECLRVPRLILPWGLGPQPSNHPIKEWFWVAARRIVFPSHCLPGSRRTMGDRIMIAGSGLAGLTAALRIARAGREVEVLDLKHRIAPSSGPHTEAVRDYVGGEALKELRQHGFDLEPFGTIDTTVRKSERFENILHGRAYYLFLRGMEPETVDQELYHRCVDAGVSFTFGTKFEQGDHADIVATGPPKGSFNVLGAGFTFSAEGSNLDQETAYALLDNNVAPGGYLVVTPGLDYHSIYSVAWGGLALTRFLRWAEEGASKRGWL